MSRPSREAVHLAQLAIEMRGDPVAASELLTRAAVAAVLGHARHSDVAVILTDTLGPILDGAGLVIARRGP